MRFTQLELSGAWLIDIEPHGDKRGFFARTYCVREFAKHGLMSSIAQCSTSYNAKRGTVRGLHYQAEPHGEEKVIRCTAGAIFDVILDIRPASPTYAHWLGFELTAQNHRMMYIPAGFAHGFQTLENDSEVSYQMSAEYISAAARGVRWDDVALSIAWPIRDEVIMSARDAGLPGLYE